MRTRELYHLGKAYAKSLAAYHTRGVARPFSASYAITNKCNLRCMYCECPLLKTAELNLEEIDILFNRLKEIGVIRLGIFGGEPLVRKDLGDVADLAKRKGFYLSLNTNMLLYDRFKEKLKGVDYFFTSLDGAREKHIQNRGEQDYDKILYGIEDVIAQGKNMTIIMVVTGPDYDSVDYVLDYAKRVGADVHFQAECFDAEKTGRTTNDLLVQEELRDFWKYILKRKEAGSPISSSTGYLNHVSEWEDYKITTLYDSSVRCAAGTGFLFVETTGLAYPCPFIKGQPKVGGIDLLKEDWKGFDYELPCTNCIVGPMVEFNELFHNPLKSSMEAVKRAF